MGVSADIWAGEQFMSKIGRQIWKKVQQITTKIIIKNKYNYKHKIEEKAVATTTKKQQKVTKTTNNEKVRKIKKKQKMNERHRK